MATLESNSLAEDQAPQEQIRFLGDLQRIQCKPGDVFVLTVEGSICQQSRERLQEVWWRLWVDLVVPVPKLLILDSGMKIGVVGAAEGSTDVA